MKRPWMPFYVADYLADTMHLTTFEHGAYLLLIMHYWQHGRLPRDRKSLAKICGTDEEQFGLIRNTLKGLFQPGWTHKRIDKELKETAEKYSKRAEAGRRGGASKKRQAESQNSDADLIPAARKNGRSKGHVAENTDDIDKQCLPENASLLKQTFENAPDSRAHAKRQPQPHSKEEPNGSSATRAMRLPGNWSLPPDWRGVAQSLGLPERRIDDQAARFRDFWHAKGGKDAAKVDWLATWRNWVRREVDRLPRNATGPPPREQTFGDFMFEDAKARRQQEAKSDDDPSRESTRRLDLGD